MLNAELAKRVEIIPYKDEEEWHGIRAKGLGGSDIGTLFGLNPYNSTHNLWLEKTGLVQREEAGEAAEWGVEFEAPIARKYAKKHNLSLLDWKVTLRSVEHPWAQANVDRFGIATLLGAEPGQVWEIGTDEIEPGLEWEYLDVVGYDIQYLYEGKTAGVRQAYKWDAEQVPFLYVLQCQFYLAVTGLPWCKVGCLLGGQELISRHIDRDEELIADILAAGSWFWDLVQSGTPPEIDGSEATAKGLAKRYATVEESSKREGGAQLQKMLDKLKVAKVALKEAEERKKEIENRVKGFLGSNMLGLAEGNPVVSWKPQSRESIDGDKLKTEYPEVYEKVRKTSSFRVLTVIKQKDA